MKLTTARVFCIPMTERVVNIALLIERNAKRLKKLKSQSWASTVEKIVSKLKYYFKFQVLVLEVFEYSSIGTVNPRSIRTLEKLCNMAHQDIKIRDVKSALFSLFRRTSSSFYFQKPQNCCRNQNMNKKCKLTD